MPRKPKPRRATAAAVRQRVLVAIREAGELPELRFDGDGDLSFQFESALVYVRLTEDPPVAAVFSPVLRRVERTEGLAARLNELNRGTGPARFFASDDSIYAAAEVFTSPLTVEHVVHMCESIGFIASLHDGPLQAEFGGTIAFPDEERPAEAPAAAEPARLPAPAQPRTRRPVGFRAP